MSNFVPEGWLLSEAEELYSRMRVPQVYDRNLVDQSGKYPVLDQSENGCVGYLNSKPEFECSSSSPLTTFANHTCAVRQMTRSFGVIQNVFPLKAKAHVSQEFLFQILKGAIPQNGYKGHYPDLREKLFLTPPLPEQQKIATILSSVDDVIEKTRAQINKLKDLKTGMMQELLTKGIGHTEFKDSPVGRIPVTWEVKRLDELSEKISDGLHSTPKYVDHSEYRFINGNNLKEGKIVFGEKAKYVSENEYLKHKKDLTLNTILMSINGTIGNLAFYNAEKVVLGKSAAYISLREEQSKYFIYFVLQSQSVKQFYDLELTGSTINNLSLRSIKDTPIPVPPLAEQTRIASILSNIDTVVRQKLERVEQVNGLKKALMQDLLTGKVRVKLTDKESAVV